MKTTNKAPRARTDDFRNYTSIIYADLHIERDEDEWVTYKLTDLWAYIPNQGPIHRLSKDESKFQVTAEDFETAKSEFWQRWAIYSRRMFGRVISVEIRNTYRS